MQDPSPARSAPTRSTRELSFAEVLDPATFTRSRRRYRAIRDSAVYCLVGAAPRALVAVDRSYHPVGARIFSTELVDYTPYVKHRFARADLHLDAGPGNASTWLASPAHAEGRSFWFWSGSTAPYISAANLARYRLVLLDVFGRDGLARLAALVGRELGDFPSRAACEDAVRRYAATAEACLDAPVCARNLQAGVGEAVHRQIDRPGNRPGRLGSPASSPRPRNRLSGQSIDLALGQERAGGNLEQESSAVSSDRSALEGAVLDPDHLRRLRVISQRTGVPIMEIIRSAVELALERPALVLPPEAIGLRRVPRVPSAPAPTDDGEEVTP